MTHHKPARRKVAGIRRRDGLAQAVDRLSAHQAGINRSRPRHRHGPTSPKKLRRQIRRAASRELARQRSNAGRTEGG
jgi:hypothetical protein